MMVTLDNIIAAGVKPDVARQWLAPIQVTCEKFQINTKFRIAAFLAQCAHESGGFTMLEENLNYSDATMAAVWPNQEA
jgi:putative chitinase